jgi:hypothetical protein
MNKILFLFVGVLILFAASCSKKAKYEAMVQEGLTSGERHDTLFLGLWLGMPSQVFYEKCWELNKEGLVRQGEGNVSVLYVLEDELKSEVDVNFYPTFWEDSIYEMPVKFNYKGWAPWNAQFSSDTLQLELVELFKDWYGDGFIELEHSTRGKAFVKVDGNRRISIYKDKSADGTVWALYTDLSKEKEYKAKQQEVIENRKKQRPGEDK